MKVLRAAWRITLGQTLPVLIRIHVHTKFSRGIVKAKWSIEAVLMAASTLLSNPNRNRVHT
jgi:hypothetical protein